MDWKDMLSQIRQDLPEGEENVEIPDDSVSSSEQIGKKEVIHVVIEKKGRKGKTATIAEGFMCDDDELQEIASELKRKLGVGGSARGGEILIQGECRERLSGLLRSLGYKVR